MGFYNLGISEVTRIIEMLGYTIPDGYIKTNFEYYMDRTSHGSTLSRLVHARIAWQTGLYDLGWSMYLDALRSDLVDIQGGTTGEGIHCGVMAGTVYDVISTFAGLNLKGSIPELDPSLPVHWKGLDFRFNFRGTYFKVSITETHIEISGKNAGKDRIKVHLCGQEVELSQDEPVSVMLN